MKSVQNIAFALCLAASSNLFAADEALIDASVASFDKYVEIKDEGDLSYVSGCNVKMEEKAFLVCVDMLNKKMSDLAFVISAISIMAKHHGVDKKEVAQAMLRMISR